MAADVFFINDVATQIPKRCLQHIENKLRAGGSAGRTRAEFSSELMLVFRLSEIAEHVGGRPKKDEAAAFVEQDGLVKHLENFRARLVNRNDNDLVVRHAPNDFHDVLGIL